MDAKSIREQLMNRKPQVELLNIPIPGLPQLTGQIYAMEISGQDMSWAKEKATFNGVMNEEKSNAAAMVRSLIEKDAYDRDGSYVRIFSDDDIDFIAGTKDVRGFGSTVILSIISRVNQVSGMTRDFLKQLEPNSTATQNTGSPSA